MKKERYYLCIDSYEFDVYDDIITKQQFNEYIRKYDKMRYDSKDSELPCELISYSKEEHEKYTNEIYIYRLGCTYMILKKVNCKDGYFFKNR